MKERGDKTLPKVQQTRLDPHLTSYVIPGSAFTPDLNLVLYEIVTTCLGVYFDSDKYAPTCTKWGIGVYFPKGGGAPGRGRGAAGPRGRPGSGSELTLARCPQDVFLMIRRHKTTIFTDVKESNTVFELKRIVEGILERPPDEQRLYEDDQLLDDSKTLGECGFTSQTARPQAPATVGLAFRADEAFEALRIEPFSSPPELPDVMKPQDSGSSANEQAVQ
ncbi:hypothetical protein CapIbe_009100 [Capra ibex]